MPHIVCQRASCKPRSLDVESGDNIGPDRGLAAHSPDPERPSDGEKDAATATRNIHGGDDALDAQFGNTIDVDHEDADDGAGHAEPGNGHSANPNKFGGLLADNVEGDDDELRQPGSELGKCESLAEEMLITSDDTDRLPTIISRASTRLMEARGSAEVLEAKQAAEMALHYAKLTKAAYETHGDCLRIITRAEMRMADEIDKAQAAGTVGKRGRVPKNKVRAPDIYKDLGIPRQRVPEWRELREAGPKKIDSLIDSVVAEGRAPTKTDILKGIRAATTTASKARTRKTKAVAAVQSSLSEVVFEPDFQAEAQAEARDLEMDRDERIALSGAEALAAENEELKRTNALLTSRISELLGQINELKLNAHRWRERAKNAGWGKSDG
ncbi:hypothetical protein RSO01_77220 [Reyranella soli]|uniref:Uncharacterized protein n=2 Tax=Reyranella soli TaxID=1230389 RepID=A0A512NNL8_9HYPH|nr:hypothetical protein RSO01_77220 [Reyranella soli]